MRRLVAVLVSLFLACGGLFVASPALAIEGVGEVGSQATQGILDLARSSNK